MAAVGKWFKPKRQTTTQQSSTEAGFDPVFEEYGKTLAADAMAMRNQPSTNKWIDQAGGLFSDAGNMASGGFTMANAQPFIDQYLEAGNAGVRAIDNTLANNRLAISGRSGLGRGGSGDILAQSIAGSEAAARKGDLLSTLGAEGLQFARNSFNQDIANQMRVGSGLMSFGVGQRDFGINRLTDIGRVLGVAPKRTYGNTSTVNVGPKSNPAMEWLKVGSQWMDAMTPDKVSVFG